MVTDPTPRQTELKLAVRGRNEADRLLERLLHDRRKSEQRLAAAGKQDPMKRVTGVSALDRAIESTRVLISNVDDLVDELRSGPAASGPSPTNGTNGAANGAVNGAASGERAARDCEIVITVGAPQVRAGAAP